MSRVFYGTNETLKHLRYFFGFSCKAAHLFCGYHFELCGKVNLSSELRNRTFGNIQKMYKFLFCLALRALRNIGWNRNGGPGYLIVKSKVFGTVKGLVDHNSQLTAALPYFQLFKVFVHNAKYTAILSTFNFHLSTLQRRPVCQD